MIMISGLFLRPGCVLHRVFWVGVFHHQPLQENQSCLNKQIRDGKSEKQGLRGEKKGGYCFLFATLLHVLFACGFLFLFSH